jgi:hypothetical protein
LGEPSVKELIVEMVTPNAKPIAIMLRMIPIAFMFSKKLISAANPNENAIMPRNRIRIDIYISLNEDRW